MSQNEKSFLRPGKTAARLVTGFSLASVLFLVVCLVLPSVYAFNMAPKTATPEKWAIVTGVSNYQYISDLKYCNLDAQALADQLAATWGTNHVKLLTGSNATKVAISNAITTWLAPLEDSDDTVLFFFSGHGGQGSDVTPIDETDGDDEYICPYDSLTSSWANDIRDDELATWLNGLDAGKSVVMLDSCFAGGFMNSMATTKLAKSPNISPNFDVVDDGFAKDMSKTGRVVLAASAESEESGEYTSLAHGLFSYYLIDALNNFGTVDTNANSEVSAEEVFAYANPKTLAYAASGNDTQHPTMYDGYAGELPLITTATVTVAASSGVALLAVDGVNRTCSQPPSSLTWAINTVHAVNVSGQAYERIENGTVESQHPYSNYCNSNWTVACVNATQMRVHFNYIQTERTYDRVYLTDAAGRAVVNYTGNFTDLWSPWVNGSSVKIRLYSDYSKTFDGFKVDCYEVPNERRTFAGWSDGDPSSYRVMTAAASQNLTAMYRAEHYLQVNSVYGNATGSGWYVDGSTAYATLSVDSTDFGNGTRRAFAAWSGDASGQNASASNPITMNAAKTATATWKIQHQVSFVILPSDGGSTSPSGNSTWLDANSTVPVTASSGIGYQFSAWISTGAITIANTSSAATNMTANGPGTITANFVVQVIPETTLSSLLVTAIVATAAAISLTKRKRPATNVEPRDN